MNNNDDKILSILDQINSQYSYEVICELSHENRLIYDELLNNFIRVNGIKKGDIGYHHAINIEKGKALESLVNHLISSISRIFTIKCNVKTGTNEFDHLIGLTQAGKTMASHGIIDNRFQLYISECKNYESTIANTYVGKLYSLLKSTAMSLGIIFSYHGLSGRNKWSDAQGLVKKLFMMKEDMKDKIIIIDFNIKNFEEISNGKPFLQIIDDKIESLRMDTSYEKDITPHPAESIIKNAISITSLL